MTSIRSLVLDVPDVDAAKAFYSDAFDLPAQLRLRQGDAPTSGFRAFHISLLVSQPANAAALFEAAVGAGAAVLKPLKKGMWGFGGVVQAPDGAIWKIATSSKKDRGPATRDIDQVVLLLGADDVAVSKQFYLDHGLKVAKSFGKKYVEFEPAGGAVTLGLYGRKALARDAGVAPEGSGSHRLAIAGAAGSCTDPDGFTWEPAEA